MDDQISEPELVFRDEEQGLIRYYVIVGGHTIDIDLVRTADGLWSPRFGPPGASKWGTGDGATFSTETAALVAAMTALRDSV